MEPMWMWAAVGVILLAVEMATGTFYVLWFGVAALCVAIVMWLFPSMSEAAQYAMYAALSLGSLTVWKLYYKKTSSSSSIGQSKGDEIGRVGTVIETASSKQNGKIRFTQGLMGSREWTAIADETIEAGCEAMVVAVVGNALKISKK
jgi:inner membrane protein